MQVPEKVAYKWRPLEDLPEDWPTVASSELATLGQIWEEQRERLQESEGLRVFNERLVRELAIESGIIERIYTLDRGITLLLIEKGIDAALIPQDSTDRDPGLVADMIRDHQEAVEGLFDFVKGNRPLSVGYIKELHAVLTRNQSTVRAVDSLGRAVEIPLLKEEYKRLPNNPTRPDGSAHEYCPPEQVASEMDRLVSLYRDHESLGVPPEVEASWFHHRFSQIHPFQDGNGRVARCLATLVFLKAHWFPLVVTRDDREKYISALEEADLGNPQPLGKLFADIQKRAFLNALSVAEEVLRRPRVKQVIEAVRDTLARRWEVIQEEWEEAKSTARALQGLAVERLEVVAADLQAEIGVLSGKFDFFVDQEPAEGGRDHYFRGQVIETAKKLSYFANTDIYHAWARLVLRTETQAEVLLSFHGTGHEYRGVLALTACFFRREETEKGEREVVDQAALVDEVFQINYREPLEQVEARFNEWIEQVLVKGLEMWRRGI